MRITPSQLARVANCPRSETIEHTREFSEPARNGTVAHRFLANVLLHGMDGALAMEEPVDQEWLSAFDLERLPAMQPDTYAPEVAFAWNPKTGEAKELGRMLSREEARARAPAGWMVGVADIAGVSANAVFIGDYKTGWGFIDPPSINLQVLTYAMMAARAYGKDEAIVQIIRARSDGFVWRETYKADFFRLAEHETAVAEILRRVEEVMSMPTEQLPSLVEGPWCGYCPARFACPSKTYQLKALAEPSLAPDGLTQSSRWHREIDLSPEALPLAWERIKFAEKMLERIKNEVKERARVEAVPLGGGYVLGERECVMETILPGPARQVLVEAFGEELGRVVANACIESSEKLTKEGLKAALRKHVLPSLPKAEAKITKVFQAIEERFRDARAVSTRVSKRVDEHKVAEPKEAERLLPTGEEAA